MGSNAKWVKIMNGEGREILERESPNLSIMVGRGNQRVSKKVHFSDTVQSAAVATPTPSLPFGILSSNPNDTGPEACPQCQTQLSSTNVRPVQADCGHITCRACFLNNDDNCLQCSALRGPEACPQCQTQFNSTNLRPVQADCGHWTCRACFLSNDDDDNCPQCNAQRPRNASTASRRFNDVQDSKADELDLSPPILTVEEPLASGSFISSDMRRISMGPLKEGPVLSSVSESPQKPPSTPSQAQRALLLARLSMKISKLKDSRKRLKA